MTEALAIVAAQTSVRACAIAKYFLALGLLDSLRWPDLDLLAPGEAREEAL